MNPVFRCSVFRGLLYLTYYSTPNIGRILNIFRIARRGRVIRRSLVSSCPIIHHVLCGKLRPFSYAAVLHLNFLLRLLYSTCWKAEWKYFTHTFKAQENQVCAQACTVEEIRSRRRVRENALLLFSYLQQFQYLLKSRHERECILICSLANNMRHMYKADTIEPYSILLVSSSTAVNSTWNISGRNIAELCE